jgi:zinc D-Ala-D-Ala carboxypeptidase
MENISRHVSHKEGVRSNTAARKGIENTPSEEQLTKMKLVSEKVFEPLRKWVGGPIKINSFFRCYKLNKAIGGSKTSQHMSGQAMDIDDTFGHKTNAEMFNYIKDNLDFDQMIWEFGDDDNPDWVHISYVSPDENRGRRLKAYRVSGKTRYKVI